MTAVIFTVIVIVMVVIAIVRVPVTAMGRPEGSRSATGRQDLSLVGRCPSAGSRMASLP